jgi:hypothetical protein
VSTGRRGSARCSVGFRPRWRHSRIFGPEPEPPDGTWVRLVSPSREAYRNAARLRRSRMSTCYLTR